MAHDTLGDVATYLRGTGLALHVRYQGARWVAWLTGSHGETRALGSGLALYLALDAMTEDYESKHAAMAARKA